MPRRVPPGSAKWTLPRAPRASDLEEVTAKVEADLLAQVDSLRARVGSGQEQGAEAGGPDVNLRREAISALMSRMPLAELEKRLPRRGRKLLATIKADLAWLKSAERQPIAKGKPFNFDWSTNPMSTPDVLDALATRRAAAASEAADAIEQNPELAYDATNDSLLCHLNLEDPSLRAQVLADTLIQFRAKRRSEALMDAELAPDEDVDQQAQGRIASSGTVSSFEQRLALATLPKGRSFDARREYALARLTIGGAAAGSVNNIYTGRNAVASLPAFMGHGVAYDAIGDDAGLGANFHDAIHKSYSANTPNAVEHYLKARVFTGGAVDDRPDILRALVDAASQDDLQGARDRLAALEASHGYVVPDLDKATTPKKMQAALIKHLKSQTDLRGLRTAHPIGLLKSLRLILLTYQSVVLDRPSVEELERKLFYAGDAHKDVARLIDAMKKGSQPHQLAAVGAARTALRKAFDKSDSAFERQMMLRLDRRIELLSTEIIGATVDEVEGTDDPARLGETLLATKSALDSVLASGLDSLRARKKTAPVADLSALSKQVDAMLKSRSATVDEVRALMTKVHASATEVADAMTIFFRRRESAIRFSGIDVELDPDFTGNLVKETPLQHLLSLANHGRTFGMKTEISADAIRFVGGMRVLNSTGPRVYQRILVAKTPEALRKYKPTVNDLCVVESANEKNLVFGGGLVLDTEDAGPGLAHAAVFAKGHGINAIALPDLRKTIDTFFDKAAAKPGDGDAAGFYVDPRVESFVIKPLSSAIEEGLVEADAIEHLRPGFNLDVDYFDVDDAGRRVRVDEHQLVLSDAHSTRRIEIVVPDLEDRHDLGGPASFGQLGALELDRARQVCGEKGAVLVDLAKSERLAALGVKVPDGGVIPPFAIKDLLQQAELRDRSLYDAWLAAPQDPKFADPDTRGELLKTMKGATIAALDDALVAGGKPTALGKKLLAQVGDAMDLDRDGDWIFRSSFTAEDRPNKSGAGQYDSFVVKAKPKRTLAARRLQAIAKVIGAAWNESAVESNLQAGMRLEHVWPSIVVQDALSPTTSGVAVSRGATGGFGEVRYQATPEFGGGVGGGDCEEGVIGSRETAVSRRYPEQDASLLSREQQAQLRAAILAIEEDFHERIEPGKGHAVDVEWAFVDGQLNILQARVITGV